MVISYTTMNTDKIQKRRYSERNIILMLSRLNNTYNENNQNKTK